MKKKILFCGASGYANLGDDAYKVIFEKYLSDKYELIFTHPYPDESLIAHVDYIVIGGGGLIYDNETSHFDYMTRYLKHAVGHKKHFSFISCGVQVKMSGKDKQKWKQIQKWQKYLELADVVTVRSAKCNEFIKKIAPNCNIKSYPDLVYLLQPSNYKFFFGTPEHTVFIPTPTGSKTQEWKAEWGHSAHLGKKRIVLCMSKVDRECCEAWAQKINDKRGLNEFLDCTPEEAARVIKDCRRVVTCRYHGIILGNAFNKEIVKCDTRFKSVFEVKPENKMDAYGNIKELIHHIEKNT